MGRLKWETFTTTVSRGFMCGCWVWTVSYWKQDTQPFTCWDCSTQIFSCSISPLIGHWLEIRGWQKNLHTDFFEHLHSRTKTHRTKQRDRGSHSYSNLHLWSIDQVSLINLSLICMSLDCGRTPGWGTWTNTAETKEHTLWIDTNPGERQLLQTSLTRCEWKNWHKQWRIYGSFKHAPPSQRQREQYRVGLSFQNSSQQPQRAALESCRYRNTKWDFPDATTC